MLLINISQYFLKLSIQFKFPAYIMIYSFLMFVRSHIHLEKQFRKIESKTANRIFELTKNQLLITY